MRLPFVFEPYAILVADMIGYSQRLALDSAGTHAAFRAHLHEVFEPSVGKHIGRIVKTTGDGIVAIFADAGLAERCAREIQRKLQASPEHPSLSVMYRVAVHHGEVVIEEHDIFGLDVNTAIHMQRLAPPGGVCLSHALFVRLPEQGKARYRYLGQRYLKNVPAAIAIYTYDPTPFSTTAPRLDSLPTARRSHLRPPPRLGVAGLPIFTDAACRRVCARIAQDSLTRGLSRFREVFAVALIGAEIPQLATARARYRKFLSTQIACDYLLHGHCIINQRTLDLIVHLESMSRAELIWSGKLTIDLEQQFDLVDALIGTEIVAPVVLYLEKAEAEPWSAGRLSDDELLFRRAKRLIERRTLESLDQARRLLSEIAGRCGEVGDVYIALAHAEHSYGLLLAGQPFAEALERAWGYAKKAIEINDLNPRAHAELALQEMFLKRQSDAGEIYQHALRLNPYDPMLRADWADCLVNMGRPEEAVPILKDILSGWPRDRAWVEWNLCDAYWHLDQPDRIIALLDRHPDQPYVHRYLAASYAKLGKIDQAKRHAEKVRQHQPDFSIKAWSRVVPFATTDSAEEYAGFLARAGL
jgi:class 3 adenylate cyclase/tetratricopeptide (TPR) repeat protein